MQKVANNIINNPIIEEQKEESTNNLEEESTNNLEEESTINLEEESTTNLEKLNITINLDIHKVIFFIILGIILFLLIFKYDIINKKIEYINTSHILYTFGGFLAIFKIIGDFKTNKNNISLYLYLVSIGLLNLKNLMVLFESK